MNKVNILVMLKLLVLDIWNMVKAYIPVLPKSHLKYLQVFWLCVDILSLLHLSGVF